VRVESDLDLEQVEFKPELTRFAVGGPGDDNVTLRHYFHLPDLQGKDLGRELYRKTPWAISRKNGTWYYLGISPDADDPELHRVGVFNASHTHARIYSPPRDEQRVRAEGFSSLSLFPTDQIWLGPLLADRQAVLLHSSGVILNGRGLIFVGHSEAGKSTTVTMLKSLPETAGNGDVSVEVLCDDRNIVRRREDGWRVHGTWSHGDVPDVSPASAPLRAILFLEQAQVSEIVPLKNRKDIWVRLLATLIRPMVTAAWWQKELEVLEGLVNEAPCYLMRFDKSGDILPLLLDLIAKPGV